MVRGWWIRSFYGLSACWKKYNLYTSHGRVCCGTRAGRSYGRLAARCAVFVRWRCQAWPWAPPTPVPSPWVPICICQLRFTLRRIWWSLRAPRNTVHPCCYAGSVAVPPKFRLLQGSQGAVLRNIGWFWIQIRSRTQGWGNLWLSPSILLSISAPYSPPHWALSSITLAILFPNCCCYYSYCGLVSRTCVCYLKFSLGFARDCDYHYAVLTQTPRGVALLSLNNILISLAGL